MKELEDLIEKNRARADSRVQHRWAYEHLTVGPLARTKERVRQRIRDPLSDLNCHGAKFYGQTGRRLQRLLCFVDNWQLYSASLATKIDLTEPVGIAHVSS